MLIGVYGDVVKDDFDRFGLRISAGGYEVSATFVNALISAAAPSRSWLPLNPALASHKAEAAAGQLFCC